MKILVDDKDSSMSLLSKRHELVTSYDSSVDAAIIQNYSLPVHIMDMLQVNRVPILGTSRYNKMFQAVMAETFGFRMPKTYFNRTLMLPFKNVGELDAHIESEKFVMKPMSGARGIGVTLLDRKRWYKLYSSETQDTFATTFHKLDDYVIADGTNSKPIDLRVEQLGFSKEDCLKNDALLAEERYLSRKSSDSSVLDQFRNRKGKMSDIDEDGYTWRTFRDFEMIYQEYVEIKREYRIVLTATDHAGYERIKDDGQFLGNLAAGAKAGPLNDEFIKNAQSTFKKIRKMMEYHKYPWLSVDLYERENGNVGCFEFQMEFAWEGLNGHSLSNMLCDGVEAMVHAERVRISKEIMD